MILFQKFRTAAKGTSLLGNVVSNYGAQVGMGVVGLVSTAFYYRNLGAEGFGLIGIYLTLQMFSQVLNLGLSPGLQREMARQDLSDLSGCRQKDALRVFGFANMVVAGVTTVVLLLLAPWLASKWLNPNPKHLVALVLALQTMAVAIGLQFLVNLQQAALVGLERQVWSNGLNALFFTVRQAFSVGLLWAYPAVPWLFFAGQVAGLLLHYLVLKWSVQRLLPSRADHRLAWPLLGHSLGFISASAGGTVVSLLTTQMDRIILSRLLSLETFGQYSLLTSLAPQLLRVSIPVVQAVTPRLTSLVTSGNSEATNQLYKRSYHAIGILVAPVAACLILLPQPVLAVFIGDVAKAKSLAPLLSLMALSNVLGALVAVPNALLFAYGNAWFGLLLNIGYCVAYLPLLWVATLSFGMTGTIFCGLALAAVNFVVYPSFIARRYLPGSATAFWLHGWLWPSALALICTLPAYGVWFLSSSVILALAVGAGIAAVLYWRALNCLRSSDGLFST
ncbi:MAG: oligosaccharide flippase family protein [Opitutaceae bacterium]|nr:oligosaccharide flippase family protein [Opitutaceae bacterium]